MPLPPVGVLLVRDAGVLPLHIARAADTVWLPITGLTVINNTVEVPEHPPEVTVLLNHVFCVKAAGE